MSSTSDTSAIDEKKGEDTESEDNLGKDIGKFFMSLATIIIVLILYFSAGGSVLYGCKIGQANILPTDEKCMPYDSNTPNVQKILINIFEANNKEGTEASQKISFSYDKNKKNTILDMLRDSKQKPNASNITAYIVSIIEGLFLFNFSALNTFLNLLNQIPECLILIFGPIIMMFYVLMLMFVDFFYVIYLWFYQMTWFFSENTNKNDSGKPKWQTSMSPSKLFTGCVFMFVFFIIFWLGLLVIPFIPFLSPIVLLICIGTILGCKGEMNNKEVSVGKIIKDVFKYNKVTVSSVFSVFLVLCAFANLGGLGGGISIGVILFIYFVANKYLNVFNSVNEENLSKIASYDQATKTCKISRGVEMMNFVKSLNPFNGGDKIAHEIKKIGGKLNKN